MGARGPCKASRLPGTAPGWKGEEPPGHSAEQEEGLEKAPYHVGLPAIDVNAAVNAPPEIIL